MSDSIRTEDMVGGGFPPSTSIESCPNSESLKLQTAILFETSIESYPNSESPKLQTVILFGRHKHTAHPDIAFLIDVIARAIAFFSLL